MNETPRTPNYKPLVEWINKQRAASGRAPLNADGSEDDFEGEPFTASERTYLLENFAHPAWRVSKESALYALRRYEATVLELQAVIAGLDDELGRNAIAVPPSVEGIVAEAHRSIEAHGAA